MCYQIDEYRQLHNNNFSDFYDLKQIDDDAEYLLKEFGVPLGCYTPICEIANQMGFSVFLSQFKKEYESISGMLGISTSYRQKYKSDQIILVNKQEELKRVQFIIAQELAHYIYDFDEHNGEKEFCNTIEKSNNEQSVTYQRANRFAYAFILPKTTMNVLFNVYKTKNMSFKRIVSNIADYFDAPIEEVEERCKQIGLC